MTNVVEAIILVLLICGVSALAYQYRVVTVKLAKLRKENAELKHQLAIFETVNELRGNNIDGSDMFVPPPPKRKLNF